MLSDAPKFVPAGINGNHKINYIVSGTPRSGTGFMAKLLTSAGIPIGHEMFFGMPGHGYYPKNAQGDSSWMAVPFIHNFDATVIHIVRNPIDNISSLLHRETFSEERMKTSIYTFFKMIRLPDLARWEGMDKYLAFYLAWNKEIDQMENIRVNLEHVTKNPTSLLDELGIVYDPTKLYNKKYNQSNRPTPKLTLDNFKTCNPELLRKFIALAKAYGYDLEADVDKGSGDTLTSDAKMI